MLALGSIAEPIGLIILFAWVIVFLATLVTFTLHVSEGSSDWYQYGSILIIGILIALTIGLIFGYDLFGTALLSPFAVMGVLIINWFFIDKSEEEFDKDLKKLKKEIE